MTYEVQQTRWDRLIRRVSGSIGPGSRVSETLSELFPTLDVEQVPGELLALSGTQLMFGGTGLVGAAGENAKIQLFNPIESGHLVTISTIIVSAGNAQLISFGLIGTALATLPANPRTRDGRLGVLGGSVAQVRNESTVGITPTGSRIQVLANEGFTLQDPNGLAVLSPNTGLQFSTNNVATSLTATFFWRERPAQESELQF